MSTLKKVIVLFVIFTTFPAQAQRTPVTDRTTNTRSSAFDSAEARVTFLDRYLNFPSEPKDAQYHLVYHDNSQGFPPGPSDWDIRIVVWLEPGNASLWLEDMKEVAVIDGFDWVLELSPGLGSEGLENARYFEASGKRAALLDEATVAL